MAIATTTAIAAAGLAISAGTTAASFSQAAKQKKLQREAEADASKAMAEARKKLDVNFYEQLGIQKEPYNLEREAMIIQGAQAIEAGKESERGAAALAGRVQLARQQGEREIAAAMGQEMLGLEKARVAEESRLRDMGISLDLGEVEGAQLAARDAQQAAVAATQQGVQGLSNMAQQGLSLVPLYGQDLNAQKQAISQMSFTPEQSVSFEKAGGPISGFEGGDLNLSRVGQMTNAQYRDFVKSLSPQQKQMLFGNKQYTDLYNPFNPF
jgi:hypothetical protein